MKFYEVGGAIRDDMMGLPVVDRDYVVVGGSPEQLEQLGYKPVGKDFPVFLHPETHQEYALARTERKIAVGYKGFAIHCAPDVTLEQDLQRRDLTINAMARDEAGVLYDPYGGAADLASKVLRHVSSAFVEDPLRVLRVARFAARFPEFGIAPETRILMREVVLGGELADLAPERVWQELSRGLMTDQPGRMLQVLADCGALPCIFGEWIASDSVRIGGEGWSALNHAAYARYSLPVRFAVLLFELMGSSSEMNRLVGILPRLRVPGDSKSLAMLLSRTYEALVHLDRTQPRAVLQLLLQADAVRRPVRLDGLLQAFKCICAALGDLEPWQPACLQAALAKVAAVDGQAIAQKVASPQAIAAAIETARLAALTEA